jgi:uncharacterized protein YbjQ (UPF0145 family)
MEFATFIVLMLLGYGFGTWAERRHYKSIEERETRYQHLPTIGLKQPLPQQGRVVKTQLAAGNVVISVDYFKRFLAALRNIFGGRVISYETLVDRARREATLRMKESCPGATQIINVRLETASLSKNTKKGSIGSIEVFAYGTALTYK